MNGNHGHSRVSLIPAERGLLLEHKYFPEMLLLAMVLLFTLPLLFI